MPWSLRLVLIGALAAALLTLGLSEVTVRAALHDAGQITQVVERMTAARELRALLIDAETSERGYLLTGEAPYLDPYKVAVRDLPGVGVTLSRLVPASSPLHPALDRINALASERMGQTTAVITLATTGDRAAALGMVKGDRGRIVMDEIRRELGAFEVESLTELDALQASQITSASRSRLGLLVATALVIGLLFLVSRLAIGQASIQLLLQQKAATEATRMQQVIAARTRELAELSTHIQTVTEREKAELARNLHDELGGLLTAANMDLAWLKGAAAGRDPTGAEKLHQLGLGLTEAMDVKRRVVESLRPALLDHFGLSTAFQNHFEETCQKAGLGFTAVMPGTLPGLPEELSIALFRVGQEALTNVIRHAKAKNVQLTLSADGGNVALSIEDDGIGIDTKSGNSEASHGIIGMRHRVETLGGTFTLQSTPGNGTRLKIQVPRQRPARFAPEVGF